MPTESAFHVLTGQNARARSVTEKQTVPKSLTDLVLKNDRPCPVVRWSGDVVAYNSRTVPARERSLDSFVLLPRFLKYLLQDENGIRTSQCGHRDADQKDRYRSPSSQTPHPSPIISYAGKVCGGFGQGLLLGGRPCPANRPLRYLQGGNKGHGLSLKNRPCPNSFQIPSLRSE